MAASWVDGTELGVINLGAFQTVVQRRPNQIQQRSIHLRQFQSALSCALSEGVTSVACCCVHESSAAAEVSTECGTPSIRCRNASRTSLATCMGGQAPANFRHVSSLLLSKGPKAAPPERLTEAALLVSQAMSKISINAFCTAATLQCRSPASAPVPLPHLYVRLPLHVCMCSHKCSISSQT